MLSPSRGNKRRGTESPSKKDAMALLNFSMSPKHSKSGSPRKKFRGASSSPRSPSSSVHHLVPMMPQNRHMITPPPPSYVGALNSMRMMNVVPQHNTSSNNLVVRTSLSPRSSASPRKKSIKANKSPSHRILLEMQKSPSHLKSSVSQITKEDVKRVRKLLQDKVTPADSRIIENRGCHICHTRAAKVIMCCAKGFVSHSFCVTHVQKLWGIKLSDIEKDPTCFRICPVCSLQCPCSACQRKLRKTVKELCTYLNIPLNTNTRIVTLEHQQHRYGSM